MSNHISRALPAHLREISQYFPVISLTGPRQSGKTTLLREHFRDYTYVNLEDPRYRDELTEDPRGFLERFSHRVIFDEAQYYPDLFSYLQLAVDEDRMPGRFVVSGSQNFLLNRNITQSLAGRVGITRLLPLDLLELEAVGRRPEDPATAIYSGFYPDAVVKATPPAYFYPSYIGSYLDRDIDGFISARNLNVFRLFMKVLAGFAGQTINYANLSKTVGIGVATAKEWLSILEMSYVVFQLPPYFANFKKRLAKSPKLYFYDTGLLTYLLEIDDVAGIRRAPQFGALFENLIVADVRKAWLHRGRDVNRLYHYRDNYQQEADLLRPADGELVLTEIKSTATYRSRLTETIKKIGGGAQLPVRYELIYGGTEARQVDDVSIRPWFMAGAT